MGIENDGKNPQGYMGINPTKRPETIRARRSPGTSDRRFKIGSCWINEATNQIYFLSSVAANSATWALTSTTASDIDTLTGDSGGALTPTAGNMNVLGGTNITVAGAGSTLTANMDAAITLATSVTSPLFTSGAGADLDLTAAAGQDAVLKLGDDAGANFLNVTDVSDVSLAVLDSNGAFTLLQGDFVESRSSASGEVLAQVTNSDNTAADSDAFFEVAVGGTSSGNPGIRFQISGGQNYSMGIDNADSDKLVICADNDLGTDVLMKFDETTKDVEIAQGNLVIGAVAKQLQMNGGAVTDFIGQSTLTAGTVTVLNTNIASGDRVFVTRSDVNGSTALGVFDVSITPATSFVIDARNPADATVQTNDISIVDWFIVRQN